MSNNKLIQLVEAEVPGLGFNKTRNLIMRIRFQNGGSLTGLKMADIVSKVHKLLQNESQVAEKMIKKCQNCDKTFGSLASLTRHQNIHNEEKSCFKCEYCDKNFQRKDNRDKHMRVVHKRHNINIDAIRKQDGDDYFCKMCGEEFGREVQEYENHIILMACQSELSDIKLDSKLKMRCNYCEKTYSQLFTLKRHMKEKHLLKDAAKNTNKKNSGKSFTRIDRNKLPEVDKYTCPLCYRRFFGRQSRDRHVDKMHSVVPLIHPTASNRSVQVSCDICQKSFPNEKTLIQHMDWKHRNVK